MIKNLLTLAYRHLFRHKMFSLINILGLAFGIAASLLLLQYVAHELSYDDFHRNASNIYRLQHHTFQNGVLESQSAITYHAAAPAIKERYPEVSNFVRLHRADGMVNHYTPKGEVISHHETNAYYADSSFFSVFSFTLVQGDLKTVLRNPGSLIISQSTATKYFGSENPIGKTLALTTQWQGGEYVVDGVFKDFPQNSHLEMDLLFSIEKLFINKQFKDHGWYWTNFYTYLVLQPGTDRTVFETKLSSIIDTYRGNDLKRTNSAEKFVLQPIQEIHLHSNGAATEVNGDYQTVSFLFIIAILILGIAWLNYINLSTAKAAERAREVGVRKVLGSSRAQLVKQFLLESSLLTILSTLIAAILFVVASPYFNSLIGKNIPFSLTEQSEFWLLIVGVIASGTFLSGIYPAFVLSSFNPLTSLKGTFTKRAKGVRLRQVMVVVQFSACIALIVGTATIYRQLEFMRSQDLGMNIEQKVVLKAPKIIHENNYIREVDHFKNLVTEQPGVMSVTASSEVPGKQIFWTNEFRKKSDPDNVRKMMNILAIDEDFISTYELSLIAGRNFSKTRINDLGRTVIINESALKLFGFNKPEEALDQEIVLAGTQVKTIVGVVKDFHQQSLQHPNTPIVLYYIPWSQDYLTLSINGNLRNTMPVIEQSYREAFPANAFDYFFLDDEFNKQYSAEQKSWTIFIMFSILSITIACLGLFGLASFITIQRSREIAIRKVLGASVTRITVLLSKEFVTLVLIAFMIAVPISLITMNGWLDAFAYRVSISVWTFVLAGGLTVVVAFLTVGFHSIKAALRNPVESIKVE